MANIRIGTYMDEHGEQYGNLLRKDGSPINFGGDYTNYVESLADEHEKAVSHIHDMVQTGEMSEDEGSQRVIKLMAEYNYKTRAMSQSEVLATLKRELVDGKLTKEQCDGIYDEFMERYNLKKLEAGADA